MKVDILQVDQAKFHSFMHFWSNWVDVAMYDYNSTPFLLQMSISRFNRKKFRSTRVTGVLCYRQATCHAIGDLTKMKATQKQEL